MRTIKEDIELLEDKVSEENYYDRSFPYPLDKVIYSLMQMSDYLLELQKNSEGKFREQVVGFRQSVYDLFNQVSDYQKGIPEKKE